MYQLKQVETTSRYNIYSIFFLLYKKNAYIDHCNSTRTLIWLQNCYPICIALILDTKLILYLFYIYPLFNGNCIQYNPREIISYNSFINWVADGFDVFRNIKSNGLKLWIKVPPLPKKSTILSLNKLCTYLINNVNSLFT